MLFLTAFFVSGCSWVTHIRLSVYRFNSPALTTATSFDLTSPLFFSGIDYAILSLSMIPVFHSFALLYSSKQSLFLAVTLQLQPSDVSRCCCGIIKEVRSFQFNTVFDLQQSSTSLTSWYVQPVNRRAWV